jgi:galactokinase
VHDFMNILKSGSMSREQFLRLGHFMYESHESYSRCGLGSERTDVIVSRAKDFSMDGIHGAKITGGGSGGTVCLLVEGDVGLARARAIHKELCAEYDESLIFLE